MTGIIFAIITVLAWGAWLAPSQKVQFANPQIKTMYVAFGNLLLATAVLFIAGAHQLTSSIFWLPFIGGIIWALGGSVCLGGMFPTPRPCDGRHLTMGGCDIWHM